MQSNISIPFENKFVSNLKFCSVKDLKALFAETQAPFIVDSKIFALYQELFPQSDSFPCLQLAAGEYNKTLDTAVLIYNFLAEHAVNRNTSVYIMGGGTITDVAAYAVSTFKRGCKISLIPSSLLGMVDAAIGGKTAINFGIAKNLIGTFYPADEILIVPELLHTLPENEYKNGLAEMLKLWFINSDLAQPIANKEQLIESNQIFDYAKAKLDICAQDIADRDVRRLLNLGHTFGHALESFTDFSVPHGEAIVLGIAAAAKISREMHLINDAQCNDIIVKFKQYGYQTALDKSILEEFIKRFAELAATDKKKASNMLTMVLFTDYRKTAVFDNISINTIVNILKEA